MLFYLEIKVASYPVGSGIGKAVAETYARGRRKVAISDIDSEGGQALFDQSKKEVRKPFY